MAAESEAREDADCVLETASPLNRVDAMAITQRKWQHFFRNGCDIETLRASEIAQKKGRKNRRGNPANKMFALLGWLCQGRATRDARHGPGLVKTDDYLTMPLKIITMEETTMADLITRIRDLGKVPEGREAFETWLQMGDALAFLKENTDEEDFVIYASGVHTFIHAIVVPNERLNPPDVDDLMSWNFNASSSWGIWVRFSKPPEISISHPLEGSGKTFSHGEQLVFARHFEGHLGKKSYFEILQKFTHLFDLHYVAERNAYCRLDAKGDIEEVVRIVRVPRDKDDWSSYTVISVKRKVLDEYLLLSDSAIVRMFDFTRYRPREFGGWSTTPKATNTSEDNLFFRSGLEPGHAAYMRGVQIVRPIATRDDLIKRHSFPREEKREYASFIAVDWKNRVVREISTAPGATANYFTKSDLPFEVSPAFFRPEVLLRYKADAEKYRLTDRSVSCRGAWHLTTYDINEAGQVHTYIVYLRDLPYEEQLHWKAYNEPPKGGISERALTTDFEGQFYSGYDPLNSLKQVLSELKEQGSPWWTLRSDDLVEKVHYPVTTSADEWSDEILRLDQLLVEGFQEKWLRDKARELGRTVEPVFRSLKLTEECLIGLGFDPDYAVKIVAPLRNLHDLRSKLKGHAGGQEATELKRKALADFGTYKDHFRALSQECDESMRTIAEGFTKQS